MIVIAIIGGKMVRQRGQEEERPMSTENGLDAFHEGSLCQNNCRPG